MPATKLTRVTCAAGFLLTEFAASNPAHPLDQSHQPEDTPTTPVTNASDREKDQVAIAPPSDPSSQAQPERFNPVESLPVTVVPAQPFSAEPQRIANTKPERLPSQDIALTPAPSLQSIRVASLKSPNPSSSTQSKTSANSQAATQTKISGQPQSSTLEKPKTSAKLVDQALDKLPSQPQVIAKTETKQKLIPSTTKTSNQAKDLGNPEERTAFKKDGSTLAISAPETITLTQNSSPTSLSSLSSLSAEPPIIQPRLGAEFTAGDGVGYSSSFTGLRGFVPLAQKPGQNITFLEGQLIVPVDNGSPGANLIVGHRIYDKKSDRIYGGYLAYDHRNTGNNGFNQLGFGAETLGETWDARFNAYFPVGKTRQLASESINNTVTAFSDPYFQSNFLAVNRTIQQQIHRQFEAAATGFDVEAGGRIAKLGKFGDLRAYGGMYYFDPPGGGGIVGGRVRLEARPTDTLQVGLALSQDNTFGTSVAFNVGITFPPSRPQRNQLKQPLLARLGDSVYRNANIVIDEQVEKRSSIIQDTRLVTNPATGQPWRFRHAIPGVGTGDGTFENPTGTVAAALTVAQPDDIVYVQPGTNPGIPAFTIPDGVQVLSTGPVQRIDTLELGDIQLPLSGAGVLPDVVGTVTLGNRTTLSGFAISPVTGPGILGNNISQAIVRDNAIANSTAQGILLNNVQGPITITDNTIQQNALEGIALNNTQGQVDLLLARNQILNNGSAATDGDGVRLEFRNSASGNATIINNTIANNSGAGGLADGVDIRLFDAATGTFNLADNAITGNQLNGIAIDLEGTAQGTFNASRNTIANNQLNGVAILESNNAQGQFNFDANTISGNQLKGFQAIFADSSRGTVNLTNSNITGNQDDGVFLQTSDQAQAIATVLNNSITNNGNYGIFTTANGTSQLRVLASGNTISGNSIAGVSINTGDNAQTAASLQSNSVTGNALGDVEVFTTAPGATACFQPLNNLVGTLTLDDSFGGPISVETGSLPTNTITTSDLTFWSGTLVPTGTCGF